MNTKTLHRLLIVISMAAPLALSGCSGDGTKRPGDTTTPMPGEDVQPLTIPEGLARSAAAPIHADSAGDTLATLLSDPANMFAPLLSMFSGDPSVQSPRSQLTGDIQVKTVSSDGNNGFHVTYVVAGEEYMIHFEADDYNQGQYYYLKNVGGIDYFLATRTDSFERTNKNQGSSRFTYFDANSFGQNETTNATDRSFMVYGARTGGTNLPVGSASYIGPMWAQTYPLDDPSTGNRDRMRGSMRVTADFDESMLEGMVFGIRSRKAGENVYSRLSDTTYFVIGSGRIVDGQFTATLTGADSNENAPMEETVRGYEGNVLGEFYGPGAEELGAVLNASRNDRVLHGWLGGRQSDPNPPSGLHRSTADPVFATQGGGDLEDLLDAGEVFAPLTSTLLRSGWPQETVEPSGDAYVKTISFDEQSEAIRVTYVVGGEEQKVHFLPEDEQDGGGYWEIGTGDLGSGIWFGGGGDYVSTGGLLNWHSNDSERYRFVAGARTDAADLPAGTATYAGAMGAENYSQVDSTNTVRYSLRGNLSLTADFDASTLEGNITNIGKRWREPRPRVWVDLPDTTSFDISDGQIAGGQFTATLTGVDTNDSAPLHDSVRGYVGGVLGEFYGPAAEEVGGVISATRDADLRVMLGNFDGRQEEQ